MCFCFCFCVYLCVFLFFSEDISVMTAEDVPSVHSLLTEYLKQFKLAPEMTEEEIGHWLLPREGVVDCFVVRDSSSGKVSYAY